MKSLCPFLFVAFLSKGILLVGDSTLPLDERVVLHVGDVIGQPGETGLLVPVYLEVKPGGPEVHIWHSVFRFNPDVLEFSWVKLPPRGIIINDLFPPSMHAGEGIVSMRIDTSYLEDRILPGTSSEPLELIFCVREGAPPGSHSIDTSPGATVVGEDDLSFVETIFLDQSYYPARPVQEGGSITITDPPVDSPIPCPPPPDGGFLQYLPIHEKVTLEIGQLTAAPGETNLSLPLSIRIEQGGPSIVNFQAFLRFDPDVMDIVGIEDTPKECLSVILPPAYFEEPGKIAFKAVYESEDTFLSPDNSGVVANLRVCLREEAAPGFYPIELMLHTPVSLGGWEHLTRFDTAFAPEGAHRQFHPLLEDGLLTVEGEPVLGETCASLIVNDPVTFILGETSGAPGETGLAIPLSILVEPPYEVGGWTAVIRYDPTVFADAHLQYTGALKAYHQTFLDSLQFPEPGTVSLTVRYSHRNWVNSTNDGVAASLQFCLREDAPLGRQSIQIIPSAEHNGNDGRIETTCDLWFPLWWETIQSEPALQEGFVNVEGEPRQGSCYPDPPPGPIQATFMLRDGATVPGGPVAIPFMINTGVKARGFQFSIDFDEEVLEATEIEKTAIMPAGTPEYSFAILRFNNSNEVPGNAGIDEGFLVGAVIYENEYPYFYLPPNQDNEVLTFHFLAKSDVPLNTVTEVQFQDGARTHPDGQDVMNLALVTHGRDLMSLEPGVNVSYIYLSSRIGINGDVSIFVRGDSNGDTLLDLSDVIFTLGFLFLGGIQSNCPDAADANDDGLLNITDPIYFMGFFFLGEFESLPAPYPLPGPDPTPDGLVCWSTSGS